MPPGAHRPPLEHIEKRRKKAREIAWSLGDVWVGPYGWEILDAMCQHGTVTVTRKSYGKEWHKHAPELRASPIGLVAYPQLKGRVEAPELTRIRRRHYEGVWHNMHRFIESGLVESLTEDPHGGGRGNFYTGYRLTQLGKTVVRVARAERLRYKGFHIRRIRERLEMALEEMFIDD